MSIAELLRARGLSPKKGFGQNFLVDVEAARRIAEAATTPTGGAVLEIGAGLGALTRPLLDRAAHVVAIERDRDLVPILREQLADPIDGGRLTLLEADAAQVDWVASLSGHARPHAVAGNLPYQLTGRLLEQATIIADQIDRAVFMVQLEVADRLAAPPNGDAYGALSVFAQRAFKVTRAFVVKRGAFYPQPNVDSAVVRLEPLGAGPETDEFRAVVRAAFGQRRKKLKNVWAAIFGERGIDLSAAAERAGIDLSARGETLGVAEFERMAAELGA